MATANKLTYLSTKFFTENKEEYRITVTVSLDDDCRSNMCEYIQNVNAVQSLSDLIMELRIACFGKHLKNWIWMLVMPHGFTSPAAATTASTIWGSTYAIVDQNIR